MWRVTLVRNNTVLPVKSFIRLEANVFLKITVLQPKNVLFINVSFQALSCLLQKSKVGPDED